MKTFAQLDENGLCFAVSHLADDAAGPDIVELKAIPKGAFSFEEHYLGRTRRNGRWLKRAAASNGVNEAAGIAETADAAGISGIAETADAADIAGIAETADAADIAGIAETADAAGISGITKTADVAGISGIVDAADISSAPEGAE